MERQNISPSNSVKVRVFEITSMTDPETGKPGKNIKLVQVKQQRPQQGQIYGPFGGGEDSNMIKNIMGQFQSMGLFPFGRDSLPKLNLFLSESEYDLLGVRFEVNEVYDMVLKDGTIRFQKSLEGV
jgi:hypothetical protein